MVCEPSQMPVPNRTPLVVGWTSGVLPLDVSVTGACWPRWSGQVAVAYRRQIWLIRGFLTFKHRCRWTPTAISSVQPCTVRSPKPGTRTMPSPTSSPPTTFDTSSARSSGPHETGWR